MSKKESTFIQSAIPAKRGPATHYEHEDDVARTVFNRAGDVTEIHTPVCALQRVHEVLHARHTNPHEYGGIQEKIVSEIIEDCRLHMLHWPWPVQPYNISTTPPQIYEETIGYLEKELAAKKGSDFVHFMVPLRAMAISRGMGGEQPKGLTFNTLYEEMFAYELLSLIKQGKHLVAATLLQKAFFSEEDYEEKPKKSKKKVKRALDDLADPSPIGIGGEELDDDELEGVSFDADASDDGDTVDTSEIITTTGRSGHRISSLAITRLPLVEEIDAPAVGQRIASSGPRLYRPALRRPVLPQKIFIKNSPQLPGGVIVFDASSSMGVTEGVLLDCCLHAPAASIAFYCGYDGSGQGYLYVFASDGMRAKTIAGTTRPVGNAVDGPALDWMMAQEGPRILVTDRGFCGATDSTAQIIRLRRLEKENKIKVYTSYAEFKKAFPKIGSIAA